MTFVPLPDPPPDDPLPLLDTWLREAVDRLGPEHRNPTAMTLATCGADGLPDARMVLCRGFDVERGVLTFFTDRSSAKGRQLAENPRAAAVFYWEELYRQVRVRGEIRPTPDARADAYFASRPIGARISASVSRQSQPLATRAELEERHRALELQHAPPGASELARPERWGGYDLHLERIELWVGRPDRLHDRVAYVRSLGEPPAPEKSSWQVFRLQP